MEAVAAEQIEREAGTSAGEAMFLPAGRGIRFPAPTYAQAFLGLVRGGQALERQLDADLRREHGIGLHGFEILLHLGAFAGGEGRLSMTQLTRQAPLSQSRVSRLVAELEQRGLVRRSTDERDSRVVVVAITEAGLDTLRKAQETHHRGLRERLFDRLSRSEIEQLARLTAKLLEDDGR